MTAPSPTPAPAGEWWTRPRIVLPAVAALVVLVALLTPQATGGRTGDDRLSSHLAGAQGAKLLYATAGRLGWRVSQRDDPPMPAAGRGTTIHAVLARRWMSRPKRPMAIWRLFAAATRCCSC